ncbi:hypothetical protein EVAR_102220_1 [Eumeta japonica]|uniref:Uncharacterized protein n=1 Tax=Eumeta variegata TaxID=151549 RepID=A0A4C1WGM5_EUMVA|nr:hypothetical protein EVAR_102220_1 [Eumeta japonica]
MSRLDWAGTAAEVAGRAERRGVNNLNVRASKIKREPPGEALVPGRIMRPKLEYVRKLSKDGVGSRDAPAGTTAGRMPLAVLVQIFNLSYRVYDPTVKAYPSTIFSFQRVYLKPSVLARYGLELMTVITDVVITSPESYTLLFETISSTAYRPHTVGVWGPIIKHDATKCRLSSTCSQRNCNNELHEVAVSYFEIMPAVRVTLAGTAIPHNAVAQSCGTFRHSATRGLAARTAACSLDADPKS